MSPSPFSRRPCSGPWPLAGLLLLAALLASPPAGAAFALQDSGQWFGEALSEDATLADLDGDGDTDAFVANDGANTVWINQGGAQGGIPGDFANTGQPLGSANSSAVALADLDGDGDTDAFAANGGANAVWVNQGGGQGGTAGEFASGPSLGSASSLGVALADLDGDGDTDAFVANINANRVWLNDGSGTFTDSGQALGSGSSFGVALADLDGDGDQDAFVTNYQTPGANTVWVNQGGAQGGTPGHFADSGQALGSASSRGVALADLDGDGDIDAFVTNYDQGNTIWINQGGGQAGTPGSFADSGQSLGGSFNFGVVLTDLDGDTDNDAFVATLGANTVWVNDGSGTFADSGQALGSAESWDAALGDLDGDGDTDAFVANRGANAVWIDQGGGTFADSGQRLGLPLNSMVAPGDLDGDGDTDAFVANDGANAVWVNQGGGTFADSGQALGSAESWDTALADLDGDGDTDAFVANDGANAVWVNQGGGTFADSGQAMGSAESWDTALADLDGDGDQDVFVANRYAANAVWINQGGNQGGTEGTFDTTPAQTLGSANSYGAALADLDDDGDTDAFVANYNEANIVWVNQGGTQGGTEGTFADSGQILGSGNSRGVALADLDGDGDSDAFVANYNEASTVWINQGGDQSGTKGNFADSGQALGNAWSNGTALTDLDGDGDTDAFVANYGINRIWVNDGSGTFTDSGQALGSAWSNGTALTDLDGDGDTDAFVANFKTLRVWLNHRPGLLRFSAPGYAAAEGDGSATITVRRILGADGAAEVDYATADGTAVAVSDYTTATGTLSWADGETADRTFTVAITDDTEEEGEETVNLSLSGPYGDGTSPEPEVGTPAAATLAITEETGGGSSGGGGGGCALDPNGSRHPGLLVLLALLGSLGLLRRRVRPAR